MCLCGMVGDLEGGSRVGGREVERIGNEGDGAGGAGGPVL